MDQEQISRLLRKALIECFSESELRTLCFDLGVDYDGLPGTGKTDRARELVGHFWRRGHLMSLLQMVESLRPDTRWSKQFRGVLRDATQQTLEIPHEDVLRAMGKTGPLGISNSALLAMSQRISLLTRLVFVSVGVSFLAFLAVLAALLLA